MRMVGPAERFEHLYRANLAGILGYALRRCPDSDDAADVVAETFLIAWRRLDEVPDGSERLWLFGVARRTLANQRRGRLRRSDLADRLRAELLPGRPAVDDDVTAVAVRQAMARLPQQDRELLALAIWDEVTPIEIATMYDIPAATVRSRLLRARTKLRAALADTHSPQDRSDQQGPAAILRTPEIRS